MRAFRPLGGSRRDACATFAPRLESMTLPQSVDLNRRADGLGAQQIRLSVHAMHSASLLFLASFVTSE